jgi:predicted metal-dependent hydrolase
VTELVVRRLRVDLAEPFPRLWNGGDAFRTAWFNALSMSFPVGEQFFIDSVRLGIAKLAPEQRERMAAELHAFIGQEATHRQVHTLFNGQLAAQGHVNRWAERAQRRIRRLEGLDARAWVAATAATEHITAMLADWMLRHPEALQGAPARLQTLWTWHAAEESEHRSTAFDLYAALGGNLLWRRRFMRLVSWHFFIDVWRQTLRNLRHDGALWQRTTWRSAWQLLFAREGLFRQIRQPWRDYFRADFHPRQHDDGRAQQWLREHPEAAVPVRP